MKVCIIDGDGYIEETTSNLEAAVLIALKDPSSMLSIKHEEGNGAGYECGRYENGRAKGTISRDYLNCYIFDIAGPPEEAADLFDKMLRKQVSLRS